MADFKTMAERFKSEIRLRTLGPNTDVVLVWYGVDGSGNSVPPFRTSLVPLTTARIPGAKALATAVHLDGILKNIDSLVGGMPNAFVNIADGPSYPVRVVNYELEIGDE